jgi:hypothetical protein
VAQSETVPGTGEVARFPAETLGTHKDGNTEHTVTSTGGTEWGFLLPRLKWLRVQTPPVGIIFTSCSFRMVLQSVPVRFAFDCCDSVSTVVTGSNVTLCHNQAGSSNLAILCLHTSIRLFTLLQTAPTNEEQPA